MKSSNIFVVTDIKRRKHSSKSNPHQQGMRERSIQYVPFRLVTIRTISATGYLYVYFNSVTSKLPTLWLRETSTSYLTNFPRSETEDRGSPPWVPYLRTMWVNTYRGASPSDPEADGGQENRQKASPARGLRRRRLALYGSGVVAWNTDRQVAYCSALCVTTTQETV